MDKDILGRNVKYCPITGGLCKSEKCVWYIEHQELCVMVLLAEDVREIAENLEETRNEN